MHITPTGIKPQQREGAIIVRPRPSGRPRGGIRRGRGRRRRSGILPAPLTSPTISAAHASSALYSDDSLFLVRRRPKPGEYRAAIWTPRPSSPRACPVSGPPRANRIADRRRVIRQVNYRYLDLLPLVVSVSLAEEDRPPRLARGSHAPSDRRRRSSRRRPGRSPASSPGTFGLGERPQAGLAPERNPLPAPRGQSATSYPRRASTAVRRYVSPGQPFRARLGPEELLGAARSGSGASDDRAAMRRSSRNMREGKETDPGDTGRGRQGRRFTPGSRRLIRVVRDAADASVSR